jgi:hypothetical protein
LIAHVGDLQRGALGGRLTDARITDADVPALPSGVSGTARNDKPSRELKCYSSIIALCHAPACSERSGGKHVPYGDTAVACSGRSCRGPCSPNGVVAGRASSPGARHDRTFEGPVFVVKSRDGAELKIVLAENVVAAGVIKATLADIKPGSFVGIAAMPQPDGTQRALEVLIFPEAMRGTGEGHYPWDLQPKSTMTNANVEQVVTGVDGQTLTVKYKDGEKKIIVPPDVPIVTFAPGDKADLKPGTKIFIGASKKLPDGTLQAARVNYGKDGLTPPM